MRRDALSDQRDAARRGSYIAPAAALLHARRLPARHFLVLVLVVGAVVGVVVVALRAAALNARARLQLERHRAATTDGVNVDITAPFADLPAIARLRIAGKRDATRAARNKGLVLDVADVLVVLVAVVVGNGSRAPLLRRRRLVERHKAVATARRRLASLGVGDLGTARHARSVSGAANAVVVAADADQRRSDGGDARMLDARSVTRAVSAVCRRTVSVLPHDVAVRCVAAAAALVVAGVVVALGERNRRVARVDDRRRRRRKKARLLAQRLQRLSRVIS